MTPVDPAGYTVVTSGHPFRIPERMAPGIRRYVEEGVKPGDFLCAVIAHDLFEAVGRADDENLENLPAYVAWFYNEAPGNCHGSHEVMLAWIAAKTGESA